MLSLEIIGLLPLMKRTEGRDDISIGIIDGPIDLNHPAFNSATVRTVTGDQLDSCRNSDSLACTHGTFVAGILVGGRNTAAPAICPKCEIVLRPIFLEEQTNEKVGKFNRYLPSSTPIELAEAIIEVVDAGVKLINLSIGLSSSSILQCDELTQAYEYAIRKNVLILAAAGNQGSVGFSPALFHTWVIPVAACDDKGMLSSLSNVGPSIGKRGLLAPGERIISAFAGGGYTQMSGTSFAVPFVTGGIALLWSLFPEAKPAEIVDAILHAHNKQCRAGRRSIVPPLFAAEASLLYLEKVIAL
jgi:subtilisin family serine protease